MDKKTKQHRQKVPTSEELEEVTPAGASFDTEAGRAAQGMRPDIGQGGKDAASRDDGTGGRPVDGPEGAIGGSDASGGAGIADTDQRAAGRVNQADSTEDQRKVLPESA